MSALDDLLAAADKPAEVAATDEPLDEALVNEVLTDDACWDAELQALVAICSTLEPLGEQARLRVMRWAIARFLLGYRLAP